MATPPFIARAAGHFRQPRRSAVSVLSFLCYAAGRFFGDGGPATAASLA